MKTCTKCNEEKDFSEFAKQKAGADGYQSRCKICLNEYGKEWRVKNSSYGREAKLVKRFGMTIKDYDELLESQEGGCGICKTKTPGGIAGRFHVDHCHDTNEIRGLLCIDCNTGLGKFRDNVSLMMEATKYLVKEHTGKIAPDPMAWR